MEHIPDVQLHQVWPTMNSHQHLLVTKNLAKTVVEMANLPFPIYGSIYFDAHLDPREKKMGISDGFVIGPNCSRDYEHCIAEESALSKGRPTNRGPRQSLSFTRYTPAMLLI